MGIETKWYHDDGACGAWIESPCYGFLKGSNITSWIESVDDAKPSWFNDDMTEENYKIKRAIDMYRSLGINYISLQGDGYLSNLRTKYPRDSCRPQYKPPVWDLVHVLRNVKSYFSTLFSSIDLCIYEDSFSLGTDMNNLCFFNTLRLFRNAKHFTNAHVDFLRKYPEYGLIMLSCYPYHNGSVMSGDDCVFKVLDLPINWQELVDSELDWKVDIDADTFRETMEVEDTEKYESVLVDVDYDSEVRSDSYLIDDAGLESFYLFLQTVGAPLEHINHWNNCLANQEN